MYPLSWTPILGRVEGHLPFHAPRRTPVEFSRHPFRSVFGPGTTRKSDNRNTTALQCPCGSPSWHEGKHSYSRHSPSVQPLNAPVPTRTGSGHHPGSYTPSPFSYDLLTN